MFHHHSDVDLLHNILDSYKSAPALYNQSSDRFVEKATYVKLEYARLGYRFPVSRSRILRNIKAYLAMNSLSTLSGYTGSDPEVRLIDAGLDVDGSRWTGSGAFGPGMDRRNTWLLTRSFTLGVNVALF